MNIDRKSETLRFNSNGVCSVFQISASIWRSICIDQVNLCSLDSPFFLVSQSLINQMSKVKQLPPRSKVKPADSWDLASLFKTDAAWETAFKKWESEIAGYEKFAGQLGR